MKLTRAIKLAALAGILLEVVLITPLFAHELVSRNLSETEIIAAVDPPLWLQVLMTLQIPGAPLTERLFHNTTIFWIVRQFSPIGLLASAQLIGIMLQAAVFATASLGAVYVYQWWSKKRVVESGN